MSAPPHSSKRVKLSENFYLDEFTRSEAAARAGIEIVVDEGSDIHLALKRLCRNVLQPLRDVIGPITIWSGYRPDTVNRLVGGSFLSQHRFGQAADIVAAGLTPLDVCLKIESMRLPFDQLIHEFGGWCHVSVPAAGIKPRRETLTAYKAGPDEATLYPKGLHSMATMKNLYG